MKDQSLFLCLSTQQLKIKILWWHNWCLCLWAAERQAGGQHVPLWSNHIKACLSFEWCVFCRQDEAWHRPNQREQCSEPVISAEAFREAGGRTEGITVDVQTHASAAPVTRFPWRGNAQTGLSLTRRSEWTVPLPLGPVGLCVKQQRAPRVPWEAY